MYLDIPSPETYIITFILCLHTAAPLTVRRIFEDNHNWGAFHLAEKDNLRDVEIKEVNKMLSCKDESRGFFSYRCAHCGTTLKVHFGCNSRICSNCGKNHTDKWARSLQNALVDVHHRHAVLTIPDALWRSRKKQPFSSEGLDGCCDYSDQRHNFLQTPKRKVNCWLRCRAAPVFQANELQPSPPYNRDRRWIRQTGQVYPSKVHFFQCYAKNMAVSGAYLVRLNTSFTIAVIQRRKSIVHLMMRHGKTK